MSIEDSPGQTSDAEQWARLVRRCVARRLDANKFIALVTALLKQLSAAKGGTNATTALRKHHGESQGILLCAALLPDDRQEQWSRDHLITDYIDALISRDDIMKPADVLSRLLSCRKSRLHRATLSSIEESGDPGEAARSTSNSIDEQILSISARVISSGTSTTTTLGDAKRLLQALSQWMSALSAENSDLLMSNHSQSGSSTATEAIAVRQSLGLVLLAVFADPNFVKAFETTRLREFVGAFDQSLAAFAPLLSETHMQLAQQLDTYQKGHAALRAGMDVEQAHDLRSPDGLDIGELQLSGILDIAHVNSRAGVFVYLEALLGGNFPIVSDSFMLSFLQTHYKGDYQTAAIDLVTASFDVLAIALHTYSQVLPSPPPSSKTFLVRSFIINKLPLLLNLLISMPFTNSEFIISQALGRLDPGQFHSFDSQGFSGGTDTGNEPKISSNILSDSRQRFLSACALHGLVAEQSIERILGEAPIQVMTSSGRKTKSMLLAEWNNSGQKMDAIVGGITGMEGNAGAFATATGQIFRDLCTAEDTSSLQALCTQLCQNSSVLDAMALFIDWRGLLRPLCELLNDWKAEDDQGEFQLVYEEFSSCLLLVLACAYHFDLSSEDLGISSNTDGFLQRLLHSGSSSMDISNMTAEQSRQLLGWAKALYVREEIHDELMSQCSPQNFYILVPTLLHQSILTHARNKLTYDKLLGGLELLRNAFLIPSLVFAIGWLKDHIWEQRNDVMVCINAVSRFIVPPSPNSDAQIMHDAVMNIVGQPLLERLQDVRLKNANVDSMENDLNQVITTLTERLERLQHQDFARHRIASLQEIRHWTSGHAGGPLTPLSNSISMLCFWSASAGIALSALPAYTARQLDVAVRMTGAQAVLTVVLDVVKTQTEAGMGAVALDIATAMLGTNAARAAASSTASDISLTVAAGHADGALTLREALALELQGAAKTILTDPLRAEAVVRLSRRLDAYAITLPPIGQDSGADDDAGIVTAAAAHGDMSGDMVLDSMGLGDGTDLGDLGDGHGGADDASGTDHHGVATGSFDLGAATSGSNALGLELDSALGGGDGGMGGMAGLAAAGGIGDDVDMGGMGVGAAEGDANSGTDVVGLNLGAATDDDIFAGLGDLEGMDYGM